ncbi:putative exported protein [Halobacteriovorax marinus SJ]|uniref:Exported protein n=1 Tax=Halobacteriovorax marinus (strain ATCC BAA-682 / DSM 15412 / SJ) TaxID=862908 RepID=E1WX84_HALMS|nr:YceI family protein [Halobacteriovorax marinus]CBW25785.1 putative exported protein [Halobacteriovorax marinus SJ]
MKTLLISTLTFLSLSTFAGNVDLTKSQFTWTGTKVTGEHTGELKLKSADLKFGEKNLIQSGDLVIDINSLTVTDLSGEWATKFLNHMKSDDFFNVEKFPEAKLVVKKDTGSKISGVLTIKGKSNPVEFNYKKNGNSYEGTLTFDRTKFDMIYGSGGFFKNLGDKAIHNEVNLKFKLVVKK